MRCILAMTMAALLGMAAAVNAATVGESPLAGGGSPDGWSGITVLDGYGGLPSGEAVSTFNYYADETRADGNHNVQPIIAQEVGGAYSIWAVGPVDTPAAGGEYAVSWSSPVIPADGNTYHPAIWQWATGVDNENGGLVPFNGSGGSGMFQHDYNGIDYVPAIGDPLEAQHASGADGRAYQLNFETAAAAARFCDTSTADVCFDFDADDEGAQLINPGDPTGSAIVLENGNPGGYLRVTDAVNSASGGVIAGRIVLGGRTGGANSNHHADNFEVTTSGGQLSVRADLRVGAGTDQPADGFSFSYVDVDDPVLAGDGSGWATGPDGGANLPEEGTTTGISIGFDEWQSGPAGDPADLTLDVIGLTLRIDGEIVGNASLPTLNGALDDVTSLQTGPNTGGVDALGWATLTIDAPIEGANLGNTVVTWKGEPVNFVPEPSTGVLAMISFACLGLLRRKK